MINYFVLNLQTRSGCATVFNYFNTPGKMIQMCYHPHAMSLQLCVRTLDTSGGGVQRCTTVFTTYLVRLSNTTDLKTRVLAGSVLDSLSLHKQVFCLLAPPVDSQDIKCKMKLGFRLASCQRLR